MNTNQRTLVVVAGAIWSLAGLLGFVHFLGSFLFWYLPAISYSVFHYTLNVDPFFVAAAYLGSALARANGKWILPALILGPIWAAFLAMLTFQRDWTQVPGAIAGCLHATSAVAVLGAEYLLVRACLAKGKTKSVSPSGNDVGE